MTQDNPRRFCSWMKGEEEEGVSSSCWEHQVKNICFTIAFLTLCYTRYTIEIIVAKGSNVHIPP